MGGGRCLSNEFSTICHLLLNHWSADRLFRRRVVANRVKYSRQELQVPTVRRTRPFTVRARADMGTTGRTVRAPARAKVATVEWSSDLTNIRICGRAVRSSPKAATRFKTFKLIWTRS